MTLRVARSIIASVWSLFESARSALDGVLWAESTGDAAIPAKMRARMVLIFMSWLLLSRPQSYSGVVTQRAKNHRISATRHKTRPSHCGCSHAEGLTESGGNFGVFQHVQADNTCRVWAIPSGRSSAPSGRTSCAH